MSNKDAIALDLGVLTAAGQLPDSRGVSVALGSGYPAKHAVEAVLTAVSAISWTIERSFDGGTAWRVMGAAETATVSSAVDRIDQLAERVRVNVASITGTSAQFRYVGSKG